MTDDERAEYADLLAAAKVAAVLVDDQSELGALAELYELDDPTRSASWYSFRFEELRAGRRGSNGRWP